ncbi:hypothetical protein EDD35_3756 [Amycolatopsis thermoflava]|uniref:Uncharacterized protein n=2 Tax=Amycolatopsis thermoflava TaxID=84480 RepID=A0A3N2GZ55_9PSEU|nr:hypothetical protein EDD35_3756 [Amycolatopsis thermoflava]
MLRSLRHSPPGAAKRGQRKGTFNAALEQSEQLFLAAETVSPAARPLLLFYGLSQAGRALAAVSRKKIVANTKYNLKGHGIEAGETEKALTDGLASVTVVDGKSSGAFVVVSQILGAGSLPDKTAIGSLWSLLPESKRIPLSRADDVRPLQVALPGPHVVRGQDVPADVSFVPLDLAGRRPKNSASSEFEDQPDWEKERQDVARYIDNFPTLKGWRFRYQDGPIQAQKTNGGLVVPIEWSTPGQQVADEEAFVAERTVGYRGIRYAYPAIGNAGTVTHPMLIWWAILYAMSVIARYNPLVWQGLISVNENEDAAAIEKILDDAVRVLPELIHRTILEVGQ